MKFEHGIEFVNKMRAKKGHNNPGGGVSIAYNPERLTLTEYPITRGQHELVCAKGKIKGNTRPLFILGIYLSPKLKAAQYHECLSLVSDAIMRIKTEHNNPYVIVGGDLNGKEISEAIGDFPDMETTEAGATRGAASLDISATNFKPELSAVVNHPPLSTEDDMSHSDHRFVVFNYLMKHTHHFTWIRYKARKVTEKAMKEYDTSIERIKWDGLCGTADCLADTLNEIIGTEMDKHFPMKSYKVRSTDDPWIDEETRDMINRRKGTCSSKGRNLSLIHI